MEGKRLLILGGTTLMINVVNVAREMGVYTIVTDQDPKSPAKAYADKGYDISTGDIDAIVSMARQEKVDGLFVGYEDFNTSIAVKVAEKLHIPFYATQQQIDITKSKIDFKAACKRNAVPTTKEYQLNNVCFPCVVKPSDSYSAKGITICHSPSELEAAIEFALSFSRSKTYLIEKYMDANTCDCVNIDYVLSDGEIRLSAVGDKKVVKQGNHAPLTAAVVYPSRHYQEYVDHVDSHMVEMFRSLGMKNGTVFIESFYDEDGFAIYEMGYRVGGGQSSILTKNVYGLDYVECLIRFALTGKMCDEVSFARIEPSFAGCVACGLVLLLKPGKVASIKGMDEIKAMPEVVNVTQYVHEGHSIPESLAGTLGQTFARIHIIADSYQHYVDAVHKIRKSLSVENDAGEGLLLDTYEPALTV